MTIASVVRVWRNIAMKNRTGAQARRIKKAVPRSKADRRNGWEQVMNLIRLNVPAHRPGASEVELATETQSRGSVQPVC